MTAWCLKDGLVAWPEQQERANAYLAFQEANPDVGQKDLYDMWKQEAESKGWDPGVAGKEQTPYGPPSRTSTSTVSFTWAVSRLSWG